MKKCIFYEMLKVTHKKGIWLIIGSLMVLNIIWMSFRINYIDDKGYSVKDIAFVYNEIDGFDTMEQLEYLHEQFELYETEIIKEEFLNQDKLFQINNARHMVYEHVLAVSQYKDYIAGISEQGEQKLQSPFYGSVDSFSYNNIQKTIKAYDGFDKLHVTPAFSEGVKLVTDNHTTDYFLLLCLFAVVMVIMVQEREDGMLQLLKSTANGYRKVAAAKLLTIFILGAVITSVFYLTNYITAYSTIGISDIHQPIQSLKGYLESPFKLSVSVYIILFIFIKIFGIFSVLCVLFLLCMLCKNTVYSCISSIIFIVFQLVLWNTIDIHSWLSMLKEMNIFAILDIGHYFSEYRNLNVYGLAVDQVLIGAITAVFFIAAGSLAGMYLYVHEVSTDARKNRINDILNVKKKSHSGISANLILLELRKLFVSNKGLVFLGMLLLLQIIYYSQKEYYLDRTEYYYQVYSEYLAGELTNEKHEFIMNEEELFERAQEEMAIYSAMYENGEIDESKLEYYRSITEISEYKYNGFERAKNQYDNLMILSDRGSAVSYVYQTPWDTLFGKKQKVLECIDYLKLFLALILVLCGYGAMEKTYGMDKIIAYSYKGQATVNNHKAGCGILYALLAVIIVFLPRIYSVYLYYGFPNVQATALSLLSIPFVPAGISILTYMVGVQLTRVVIGIIAAMFVLYISDRMGNRLMATFITGIILVVPPVLSLIL